jgi:hypothetical protein
MVAMSASVALLSQTMAMSAFDGLVFELLEDDDFIQETDSRSSASSDASYDFAMDDHEEIIETISGQEMITREQFGYVLDLLTSDIDIVRDSARCNFRDYEDARTALGLAAVNTLCHKGIVRGTRETKYYYDAYLTEAEAVTMIIRALYPDRYDTLKDAEAMSAQGRWFSPYYELARASNHLIDSVWSYGSTRTLSASNALALLQHNFGSIADGVDANPYAIMIYDTIYDDEQAHVTRWIRERSGDDLRIVSGSIELSLDPYRTANDVFTDRECIDDECFIKVEFAIDRENNRDRYCGMLSFETSSPDANEVSESFCIQRE